MTIRESMEAWEEEFLSPYASLSRNSKGRKMDEPQCDIRPVYQRDRDRIMHCKAFRRLKQKTQVFMMADGDHYRTRLTHSLEVSQNARTIAKALRLNEDLTEAVALGHDLGHTPFGHAGERALDEVFEEGFLHNEQSLRVVEVLEKDGRGLNLTWEVRDGIFNHQTSSMPQTMEGQIIRLSDKIAYISHDIDDAIRAGILKEDHIPSEFTDVLGHSHRERLDRMIHDVVIHSQDRNCIMMSEKMWQAMIKMRQFLFENVYQSARAKKEEEIAVRVVKDLYHYYQEHPDKLPQKFQELSKIRGESMNRAVCDYISGMTDDYALKKHKEVCG